MMGGALIFGMASPVHSANTTNPRQKCEDFLHLEFQNLDNKC